MFPENGGFFPKLAENHITLVKLQTNYSFYATRGISKNSKIRLSLIQKRKQKENLSRFLFILVIKFLKDG